MVPTRPTTTTTTSTASSSASSSMMPTKKRIGGPGGAASPEVPIFLQKAYHMIDTCDPKICSWSEDGLTFIVKNTSLFETTIIPQFFKHNKFSSFVRQLNFYGFRKVKFSNSLRIDHKLEKETAKFWRFRHDKFRKGRKDLLVEIKRTPSSSSASSSAGAASSASALPSSAMTNSALMNRTVIPSSAVSSSAAAKVQLMKQQQQQQNNKPEEVTHLKSEMQVLKQRIECMTKNIDELTDMVKKVSVKDEQGEKGEMASPVVSPGAVAKVELESVAATPVGVGNKRKKIEASPVAITREVVNDDEEEDTVMKDLPIMPDWNPSSSDLTGVVDTLLLQDPLPDLALSNAPSPVPSDDAFVDDLFQAFADEDAIIPGLEGLENEEMSSSSSNNNNPNKPDPQLMKRIEDSLSTIPKDMHEMVANKLIDAISNTQPIGESYASVDETIKTGRRSISVDETAEKAPRVQPQVPPQASSSSTSSIPLPLAVATLKTILSEYGLKVSVDAAAQQQQQQQQAVEAARRSRSNSPCSKDIRRTNRTQGFSNHPLPVVPMHA